MKLVRLDSYREHTEAWRDNHDLAMACFELEELIELGIGAFDAINRLDEWLRCQVAMGKREYDSSEHVQIEEHYRNWLVGSARVLGYIEKLEAKGFTVRRADELRSCYREVQGILAPDEAFFADEALVKLQDQAIDAHRRGETVEFEEMGD